MTKKSKYDMPPVQNFAFGGIANPSQRTFLRGSDKSYLTERQKELDAFEEQRQAYNTALQDWQTNVYNPYAEQVNAYNTAADKYNTDVYNPYKAQVDAYNAAAQQYTTDVYNPYKTQYDEYAKAVEAYNAGDRTADYTGPAEPTLARAFDMTAPKEITSFSMTAPTAPKDFSMAAPSLPFKEEDIVKYQQEAASRARKDAGNRAVAIDVVSNPDQFNFGSMSVSNRFMAKGGEVMRDQDQEAARSIIKDFEGYGYTREELMSLADKVAQAGRGGDELLAYLSPESVSLLKAKGGSGTINPVTGLPEFKGGIIGSLVNSIKRVFGGGDDDEPAAAPAPTATASEQVLASRNQPRYRLAMEYEDADADATRTLTPPAAAPTTAAQQLATLNNATATTAAPPAAAPAAVAPPVAASTAAAPTATAPVTTPTNTAAQQLTNLTNATAAAAPTNTIASVPVSQATSQITVGQPTNTSVPKITNNNQVTTAQPSNTLTAAVARDLMQRSMTTGVPTSEFDRYGGYAAVQKLYEQGGGTYTGNEISADDKKRYATQIATTGVGNLSLLGETKTQLTQAGVDNMRKNGIDEATIANAIKTYGVKAVTPLTTKSPATVLSSVMPSASWSVTPSTYRGATATGVSGYSGPIPTDFKSILSATPVGWNGSSVTLKKPDGSTSSGGGGLSTPETTPMIASSVPTFDYTSRGIGSAISNISTPNFDIGQAKEYVKATAPSNYFNITKPGAPGISAGTTALGPADMPVASALTTLGTIGTNKNLTPTMLGGMENAGYRVDRLGNRIYAPAAKPLYGFAKGGDVNMADIMAMNTETLSDEKPEEVILTNPVGTAQKMLADLSGASKASPTRQSIKRTKTPAGGGATSEKAMQLAYEDLAKGDLGSMKNRPPAMKNTESARSQMEELARVYQMKIRSAQNAAKGLSADTFGAPTLEGPTLTKGSLTKKRFKDGGEAKKDSAESAQEPGIFSVRSYATDASARMFPDQMGQDDQRDAVRHMLAAAAMSKKFGPGAAEFLGKAHERMSNPESFFSMFGIGKPRDDYEMDVHNNKLGAELGARTTSQAELEKLVRAMAMQAQNKQVEGKPWTMSKEQMKNRKGQITTAPPEYRADGSPPEGELSQEEIDAASKPAFVTPKSGKGRKEGEISRQLRSGDAYVNMAKGLTEMPYNLAGAPMDLVMMARQGLTGQAPAGQVGTSDYIKSKMTELGIRPAPPSDPTSKGFYTAGDLLSNLANPAGVTRSAVKGAQKTGEAATAVAKDFQEYNRQLAVPGASYAVRPSGSTMLTGPVGMKEDVSGIDKLLTSGLANATRIADRNEGQANILRDFWDKKARNYFTRQFGTPDDPIARGIANKQIRGSALEEDFPEYMIDQINMGKTRVKEGVRPEGFVGPGTPETRFFPKYPRAMDDFTSRYDKATNLKGNLITSDPAAARPEFSSLLSEQGKQLARTAQVAEEDKMIAQGFRPELINANVGTVTRSPQNPENVIGDGTSSAEALFKAYQEANMMGKMDEPQKTGWINKIFGEGRKIMGKNEDEVAKNLLSENVITAINKGEPVYDMQYGLQKPLQAVFDPISINKYLASLPPREAANIRFEDAVKGGLKMREQLDQRATLVDRIKSGKPVADSVFAKGVSAPLLQFEEGPYKGFAWKRIEKREATVPEGAYVGHSVGGYETGGAGYSTEKREGFGTGKWQVYTLRDNRNRPVNTIEVKMLDEFTPVVTQIKGNGRATGNTAPEKYDGAVLDFLQNYLKPSSIEESNSHLTPLLQTYKTGLESTKKERELNTLYRELGLE